MPEYGGQPASPYDDEKAELFEPVLALLDHTQLPILARRVLEAREAERTSQPSVGSPIYGSSHIVFPLSFDDGTRCAIRIPVNGTENGWNELSSSALTSEAETMRLIRRETTIPVPDVFNFFPTIDKPLRCPYILMEFITGFSLYDIWFGHRLGSTSAEENHTKRVRALKGIASAMIKLDRFPSRTSGRPQFPEGGCEIVSTWVIRQVDHRAMLDRWFVHADLAEHPIYVALKPYSEPKQYYTAMLDAYPEGSPIPRGLELLLRQLIDWIPGTRHQNAFVLTHPDFDIQNFIVSERGDLLGILDWDGVALLHAVSGTRGTPAGSPATGIPACTDTAPEWTMVKSRRVCGKTLLRRWRSTA